MRIKLNTKLINLYFLVFIFMPPQCLYSIQNMSTLTSGLAAIRYVISFILLGYMFLNRRTRSYYTKPYIIVCFLAIIIQIYALKQNGSFYLTAALSCITFMGFIAFNVIFFIKDKTKLLQSYRDVLILYLIIHVFTLIVYPNGLVPGMTGNGLIFFMGSKNTITTYVLLIFLAHCLLIEPDFRITKNSNRVYRMAILLTMISIMNRSSTTMVALVIIDAFLLMIFMTIKMPNLEKLFQRIYMLFIIVLIVGFFLLVIVMDGGNNSFIDSMTGMFNRDITFSGRRAIWSTAILYIMKNPIWGVGLEVQYNVWGNNQFVYSAHNMLLDYGVKYGCISLIFFVLSLIMVIYAGLKKNNYRTIRLALVIGLALTFATMFEAVEGFYSTWAIFLLIYLVSERNEQIRKVQ